MPSDTPLERIQIEAERLIPYITGNRDALQLAGAAMNLRAIIQRAHDLGASAQSEKGTPEQLRMHPEMVDLVLKLADKRYQDFTADDIKALMGFCVLHATHTYLRDARPA
jgi:hypothetical protein